FDEKNQITIDTNTDWPALIEASQSMGLFFNKQVFILNLPENLTTLLQKNLLQFISGLNEDSLLVLTLPKLSKAAEKQEW
ncbi:DNA polymerase III subunit delta, partial [Klebsiella pneumoniae]|nr:DNA polymerase III subunit delta [Klebsiella pneumoniae]